MNWTPQVFELAQYRQSYQTGSDTILDRRELGLVFSQQLGVSIKPFLTKMCNESAYLVPSKYIIFLGKGALPHYDPLQGASPLDPREYLNHSPSAIPQFKME